MSEVEDQIINAAIGELNGFIELILSCPLVAAFQILAGLFWIPKQFILGFTVLFVFIVLQRDRRNPSAVSDK